MGQKGFLVTAGLLGALAVMLGAFGAHGLKDRLSAEMLAIWHTAVQYHFYHALALLAVAAGSTLWRSGATAWACWAWVIGIAIFSGSLYALALSEIKVLGAITPIGGVAFIAGWVLIAVAALKADYYS